MGKNLAVTALPYLNQTTKIMKYIILICSLGLLNAQSETPSEIALQHFMEGEFLLNQGNYAMAVLEFQEALEADPN